METRVQTNSIKLYLFYMSAIVIIIAGLKLSSQIVILIFLSIFLASILSPMLVYLQKKGIPKSLAFGLLIIGLFFIIFAATAGIANSLESFLKHLPLYQERLDRYIGLEATRFRDWGISIDPNILKGGLDIKTFVLYGGKAVGNIGSFFSKMLIVIVGVAFLLLEAPKFRDKLTLIFNGNEDAISRVELFSTTIQKYFIIKTFTSFLTGAFIMMALLYFGIEYAILWGFLAFILNFIPVVGSLIAAIPALVLALIYHDFSTFIWLAIWYFVINQVISNILEPKMMGDGLGLSPAAVFFSLLLWGWILGPVGMFLAVPLTMTLKIAFDANPDTKWVGILLSNPEEIKR